MNDLDKLCAQLANDGYFVGLKRRQSDWECTLWNNVTQPHYLPTAIGATAYDAVQVAVLQRDQAFADGRTKAK